MKPKNKNRAERCVYCGCDGAHVTIDGGQAHARCVKPAKVLACVAEAMVETTSS